MGQIVVTSEELRTQSTALSQGAAQVQSELDTMRRNLEPLASSWQGAASSTFQQLWQDWQTSAAKLNESLDGISKLLGAAAETYEGAETAVKQSMQG